MPASSSLPCRVGVVVEAPQHSGLLGALDYLSATPLPPGTLVRVPLGRRVVSGIVWRGDGGALAAGEVVAEQDLKAVIEVL